MPSSLQKRIYRNRNTYQQKNLPSRKWWAVVRRVIIALTIAVLLFFSVGSVGALAFLTTISHGIPDLPAESLPIPTFRSTEIYARDGKTKLFEYGYGDIKRISAEKLEDISLEAQLAIVAVEDRDFFRHSGFSLKGIGRAIYGIITGKDAGGGSTITQQLIRNSLISNERNVQRKIKEIILAARWEDKMKKRYGKEYKKEILKDYLNAIPYGGMIYGIETASQTFWGISAKNIDLAQAAFLAAVPNAPTYYSPYAKNFERIQYDILKKCREVRRDTLNGEEVYVVPAWKNRQAKVLYDILNNRDQLKSIPQFKHVVITEKVIEEAILEPLEGTFKERVIQKRAPHFVDYVQQQLVDLLAEYMFKGNHKKAEQYIDSGLDVITSLDWGQQSIAEDILGKKTAQRLADRKASNASLLAIDPRTGEVTAMVGSLDYYNENNDGQVNVTLSPFRQMGSAVKPLVYALAFERGYTPTSMLADVKTTFTGNYTPHNFTKGQFYGPLSIRYHLARSLNIGPVKLVGLMGIDEVIRFFHKSGITTIEDPSKVGYSLALGATEMKLIDLTYAYSTFANGGVMSGMIARQPKNSKIPASEYRKLDPIVILEIREGTDDNNGPVVLDLEKYRSKQGERIISGTSAYMLWDILTDNNARQPNFSPNSSLNISNVAGKTGTTTDNKDATTLGYNPELAVGVWVGNNDGSEMKNVTGIWAAAPIWNEFIRRALPTRRPYQKPANIVEVTVCSLTNLLPREEGQCPTEVGFFQEGKEPKEVDENWEKILIDKATGKRAARGCPKESVEERFFLTNLKAEKSEWQPALDEWVNTLGKEKDYFRPLPPEDEIACTPPGDKQGIAISITTPEEGSSYAVTELEASVTIFSAEQLEKVSFFLNGLLFKNEEGENFLQSEETSLYSKTFSLSLKGLKKGRHEFLVRAVTVGGKQSSKTVSFTTTVENFLTITQPIGNSFVKTSDVNVEYDYTIDGELSSLEYRLDGGSWKNITSSQKRSKKIELSGLSDGEHEVTIRARGDFNDITDFVRFTVDTETPTVFSLTIDKENNGSFLLKAAVNEKISGIKKVDFYGSNDSTSQEELLGSGTLDASGRYTYRWKPLDSGKFYIYAIATDKAENSQKSTQKSLNVAVE